MNEKYEIRIVCSATEVKHSTHGNEQAAKDEAVKIGREGFFVNEPDGNGIFYYPPNRIIMIIISKREDEE